MMWRNRFFGRRNKFIQILLLVATILIAYLGCWWSSLVISKVLQPPPSLNQNLDHFRRSANLKHYLDSIQLLIEPSAPPCERLVEVPLITLVTSAPTRREQRDAIRNTWAHNQPTIFFMGINGPHIDEQLVDNYMEAKQYSDIVVYDFQDHYQNLTLKTVLMLKWTLDRCPQAQFVFKTDDDVFVNPWTMKEVLRDNVNAQFFGYRYSNKSLHRDAYNKWYSPRWLHADDLISEYLSGTGYIINGEYLKQIFEAAFKVPLLNLEDVYISYMVAKQTLGLTLSHEPRMSPYRPWLPLACAFWLNACAHSLEPQEIIRAWSKITPIAKDYENNKSVCSFYKRYFSSELLLY